MSADIKQLRTRIKSDDSTLHLTKAMGLVASSKIRKATEAMIKSKQYAVALSDMADQLMGFEECKKSPYAAKRDTDRICLLAVAGDRGLAGGYNANVFRLLREFPDASIIPVGKRACDRYSAGLILAEKFTYENARDITARVMKDFIDGKIDKFGIVCTKYNSLMSQEAEVRWILPLDGKKDKKSSSAIFEPDEITVLDAVIPEYIAGMIIAAVKESFASEVAARRVAMDSAGKNAQEMIDRLGLEYNRARQSSITQEITEIVAGSGI